MLAALIVDGRDVALSMVGAKVGDVVGAFAPDAREISRNDVIGAWKRAYVSARICLIEL